MAGHTTFTSKNRLLRTLPLVDLERLVPSFERIQLALRQSLEKAHKPIDFVYFLESGLGSVVATKHGGMTVEIGLFGRDGMTGTSIVLGDTESPFDCFTQMRGLGLRISADRLREGLSESVSLTDLLMQYARAIGIQTTYTAFANGQIKVEERLARWILMVHDRVDGDRFYVTREFLAMMIGVRRSSLTAALQLLETKRFIKSRRGEIFVKDRNGLIELSQGTYGPAEAEYERLTGIPLRKSPSLAKNKTPLWSA